MDVQAAAGAAAVPQQAPIAAPADAAQSAPPQAGSLPDAQPHQSGELSPALAKIFAHAGGPHDAPNVTISYRVEHDPNMIVTVFSDPETGAVIAQLPAEVMVQIAQFFDKESGVTLDRTA